MCCNAVAFDGWNAPGRRSGKTQFYPRVTGFSNQLSHSGECMNFQLVHAVSILCANPSLHRDGHPAVQQQRFPSW
jgi:hypothetical protein